MKVKVLFLAAAVTLALAACNKPADKPADAAPAADAAAAPAADAPAAAPTDAAPAAPADAAAPAAAPTASVGVPECDDYLTKVKTCLTDKVPAEQRAGLEGALEQSRTAWTQAASTPQGKAALASACKTALEQSKAQYSAMGCTL
ncbi:hypothetical protein SAMN04487939_102239 [Lysobacter sp. yr284]|uniref:hypothetical protein n=1 Tax=Lysobacter TaxID=68 RepID=UPI00089C9871|nr:hypothetical protein [Lysobacter sp. yr284]SDY45950.1 hypothetical protein SAMN04487939_102239 [Lysobacter sp. yr284]